jgi:hypothetical protein
MRFGQLEVKAIATALLQRFDFELEPGYKLRIRQMPTIGPRHGVPLIVHRRDRAPALGRRSPPSATARWARPEHIHLVSASDERGSIDLSPTRLTRMLHLPVASSSTTCNSIDAVTGRQSTSYPQSRCATGRTLSALPLAPSSRT